MSDTTVMDAPAESDGGGKGKEGKKDKSAKGGKSNLLPAIVLAVGIALAGYFLGPGSGSGAAHEEKEADKKEEVKPLGPIAKMEPISLNLADGHYLKVGLGVQLSEKGKVEEFDKGPIMLVKDLLIETAGGANMAELSTPEGREKLKDQLKERAHKLFGDEVVDFYFTDFVMQ